MRKLTEIQKNFLLISFFESSNYAGWEVIALNLLNNGECIVAGTACIWRGGIGNFIKTTEVEELVGCLLYTFDLEEFLASGYFKGHKEYEINKTKGDIETLTKKLKELTNL